VKSNSPEAASYTSGMASAFAQIAWRALSIFPKWTPMDSQPNSSVSCSPSSIWEEAPMPGETETGATRTWRKWTSRPPKQRAGKENGSPVPRLRLQKARRQLVVTIIV